MYWKQHLSTEQSIGSMVGSLVLMTMSGIWSCTTQSAPLRSPSHDYRPPTPTTADGQRIGANNQDPVDTLESGLTNEGLAPGWHKTETGVSYDPKRTPRNTEESEPQKSQKKNLPKK